MASRRNRGGENTSSTGADRLFEAYGKLLGERSRPAAAVIGRLDPGGLHRPRAKLGQQLAGLTRVS
jgi:hypothetical protein